MKKTIGRWVAIAAIVAGAPALAEVAYTDAERTELHAEIRAYLLDNPGIVMEMIQLLEQEKATQAATMDRDLVARNAEAIFSDGFSHVAGNPEGSFTIVEFVDYQCGYCRRSHPEVRELVENDGDIRLIVKEMPILGPGSELAARAAVATLILEGGTTYEALNDHLMGLEGPIDDAVIDDALAAFDIDPAAVRALMADDEVTRRLADTQALARSLQISGTPTFVFEDKMLRGYVPLADMETLVAELRAAG